MLTLAKVSPLLLPLLLAPHIAAENSTEGECSTVQYSTGQYRTEGDLHWCLGAVVINLLMQSGVKRLKGKNLEENSKMANSKIAKMGKNGKTRVSPPHF